MPAEVTIYLINGKSVGGFMRANKERDHQSNLTAKEWYLKSFASLKLDKTKISP